MTKTHLSVFKTGLRIFNTRSYWLIQFFWWLFATGYLRFPYSNYFKNPYHLYPYLFGSFIIGIGFSHFYAWIYPKNIKFHKYTWYFAIVGLVTLNLLFFAEDVIYGFMRYSKPNLGIQLNFNDYFRFLIEPFKIVAPWFLFYHLIYTTQDTQIKKVALSEAQTALKIAELENLKNQLNPHFLFNSLNSIKALTQVEPQRAKMAITMLSDLLRASLNYGNNQTITINEEIKLVNQYLTLEKIRFESRLQFNVETEPEVLEQPIPPMAIQLLVENAIKHGINKRKEGGEVSINVYIENSTFVCRVTNTGTIIKKPKEPGIGLLNLEKRLKYTFGERANFHFFQAHGKVIAEIKINNYKS